MREAWFMWRYSTLAALTVFSAGPPFSSLSKGIPLIPGITELQPANVIPLD